jgi:hypothetical protein
MNKENQISFCYIFDQFKLHHIYVVIVRHLRDNMLRCHLRDNMLRCHLRDNMLCYHLRDNAFMIYDH